MSQTIFKHPIFLLLGGVAVLAVGVKMLDRPEVAAQAQAASSETAPAVSGDFDKQMRDWMSKEENAMFVFDQVNKGLQKRQADEQKQQQEGAKTSLPDIIAPTLAPPLGPKNGKVTLALFLDLECPYCKGMVDTINSIHKKYPDLRIITMDFPLPMHPNAEYASKINLAAAKQGKYHELRDAFLKHKGALDKEALKAISEDMGLDWDKLVKDAEDPKIKAEMERIQGLANKAGIRGTPFMIAGSDKDNSEVWGGAVDEATLAAGLDKLLDKAK